MTIKNNDNDFIDDNATRISATLVDEEQPDNGVIGSNDATVKEDMDGETVGISTDNAEQAGGDDDEDKPPFWVSNILPVCGAGLVLLAGLAFYISQTLS